MILKTALFVCLAALLPTIALAGTQPPPTIPAVRPDPKAVLDFSKSLVRVNSTVQGYDFLRPWTKKNPAPRRGTGVVVGPNQVLVTAALIANHTALELERPASGERTPARLKAVDYEANLALVEAIDPAFLESAVPVHMDESARLGSTADILQLEPNGDIAPTAARITTITIAPYMIEDVGLLVFRLSAPIQQRDGSFVLPVVRDGRLLGIVMRYDNRNQTADVIPPAIINRFLENAGRETSLAFPRAGIGIAPLRDPQLRKFKKLDNNGGVLITKVDPGGAAEAGGLKADDVILSIDGNPIDSDGNFTHPDYGRIPLSFLITTARQSGDMVKFSIIRNGEKMEIPVKLFRRDPDSMSVPAYVIDKQPYFLIAGGFIFQELSRTLLQEWGPEWRGNAPQRLVHAEMFQNELRPGGEKVVVLNGVLPSPATLGYEGLSGLIVKDIDGVPIHSLDDLEKAIAQNSGIMRIHVDSDPGVIFLDGATAASEAAALAREYRIPQLKNLPARPAAEQKEIPAVEPETAAESSPEASEQAAVEAPAEANVPAQSEE